jgi:hypothetical protein
MRDSTSRTSSSLSINPSADSKSIDGKDSALPVFSIQFPSSCVREGGILRDYKGGDFYMIDDRRYNRFSAIGRLSSYEGLRQGLNKRH